MKDQLGYTFKFSNVIDWKDHNVMEKVQYLSKKTHSIKKSKTERIIFSIK